MITSEKPFITEISEEDFRKLDIVAYEQEEVTIKGEKSRRFVWKMVKLNDILNDVIRCMPEKDKNSEENYPIVFAIHINNGVVPSPGNFYFDKNMNSFTGPRTYQIGIGIRHLYSTRDYFESTENNWKVKKSETKAVYCVHLK